MAESRIAKILSANDVGATGAHQSGILVPKDPDVLSFFPLLDARHYNPRCHLQFIDDSGTSWTFAFIYYNNSLFGKGVNEYRLTRMTRYIRQAGLSAGDELILTRDDDRYAVTHRRMHHLDRGGRVLRLGTTWRTIQL